MPKGYSASGDILTRTRDGQDLNAIWNTYQELLAAFNAQRQPLVDLLSFTTNTVIEDIVQPGSESFEEATEFGIPTAIRPQPTPTARAYPFKWYDTRTAYTFQFLAGGPGQAEGASSAQLDAHLSTVMEADNKLQFQQVMKALFNNVNRSVLIDGVTFPVTALYNADGQYIPDVDGKSFNAATHTHYLSSGANTGQTAFDPQDVLDVARTVEEHGYNRANGYNILIVMNPDDANASVAKYVRNTVFASGGATTVTSLYDFIPSQGANLTMQLPPGYTLAGGLPPNQFAGLNVAGSWGPYLIVTANQIPTGYMVAVATRGAGTTSNVIGIREHSNPGLRGLVLRPGNTSAQYPLIDSYFIRGLGTAVGPRGAAAIMKLDATGGPYTVPPLYAW